jgi:hypothetical protein
VKVTVTLQDKRIPVQMFVLDELAYPVILGCEFLEQNEAVLRFFKGKRQLEIANIESALAKPSLNSLESFQLPAFIRRLIGCSITRRPNFKVYIT